MSFKKSEVAAKFEMAGADQMIRAGSYNGLLSEVPLKVAEGLQERKSNLIRGKTPAASQKADK